MLGIVLAVIAAAGVACTGLGIRLGNRENNPVDGLVVVLFCNLVLLGPLTGIIHHPDYQITIRSFGAFVAAGVTGTLLGRLCYFSAIGSVGASRTEPIKATQPVHSTIIAVIILNESISGIHAVGIGVIVLGVIIITLRSSHDSALAASRRTRLRGLALAGGAALFFGLEPIWVKLGLEAGTPVLVGLFVRVSVAAAGFFLYLRIRGTLPTPADLEWSSTKWYIAAGIANTVFILAYYSALEVSPVVVVVPIVQTSPLIVALLSLLFLPKELEAVNRTLLVGSLLVVVGAVIVTLAPGMS